MYSYLFKVYASTVLYKGLVTFYKVPEPCLSGRVVSPAPQPDDISYAEAKFGLILLSFIILAKMNEIIHL